MLFPWSVYPYMEVEEVQYQSAHHAEECLLIEPVSGICQPALDCFEIHTTSVKFLFTQRHYRILGQGKRSSHGCRSGRQDKGYDKVLIHKDYRQIYKKSADSDVIVC